jgi:hypothetical protein
LWIKKQTDRQLVRLGLWLISKLTNDGNRAAVLAKAEIHALHEKLLDPFNHRAAQLIKFESEYSNILALTKVLRAASFALEQGKQFDVALLPTPSRSLSVADFFLDEQRRYIAANSAVANFKKEAHTFLDLYFAIEKVDYGIPNFNQRVLSSLLRASLNVAKTLKQFSYEP